MGITGLLPFLEKSSRRTNINEFSGGTVAIDTYCWLHKGVFSCADKLATGQPTDGYIRYSMKFINMLLANKIKPILVFDGRHLPAKAQTEDKRREAREANRSQGFKLISMGKRAEGYNLLRRSIDVTHEMALELIKQCQQMNIDCIVAPYEADAQLAYLNISGIADVVITEDSDLTLFGCKKVFFKMDVKGDGLLVDQDKLHLAMGMSAEHFDMQKFQFMCILSGCDYLASLPGIGLSKARKFIMLNTDCDIRRALTRLGSYLNMKSLVVTDEYRDAFILAFITFKHQLVFCPLRRKQVRLNTPPEDVTKEQLHYAGEETNPDSALHLALGNWDPFTLKRLHDFDPDNRTNEVPRRNMWGKNSLPQHTSIWSRDYKLKQSRLTSSSKKLMSWPNTAGEEMILQTNQIKKKVPPKRLADAEHRTLTEKEILDTYASKDIVENENENVSNPDEPTQNEEQISPVLIRRANPFSKSATTKTSPSLLSKGRSRMKTRNMLRVRRTIIDEEVVTESKFFAKSSNGDINAATNDFVVSSLNDSGTSSLGKQEAEGNEASRNISLNGLNVNDNMDTDPCRMDIDQETHDASFTSNEHETLKENLSQESLAMLRAEHLNQFSNYDLGKSYLDVQMTEATALMDSSRSESCDSENLLQRLDVDSDFLVQNESITTLRSSLFKWNNPKLQQQSSTSSHSITRTSTKSRASTDNKLNVNGSQKSKQLSSIQKQQSLLSMYGFQKKSNLKH